MHEISSGSLTLRARLVNRDHVEKMPASERTSTIRFGKAKGENDLLAVGSKKLANVSRFNALQLLHHFQWMRQILGVKIQYGRM